MYFVKMDIKAAFDTIRQDKMIEIVENLLDKVKINLVLHTVIGQRGS